MIKKFEDFMGESNVEYSDYISKKLEIPHGNTIVSLQGLQGTSGNGLSGYGVCSAIVNPYHYCGSTIGHKLQTDDAYNWYTESAPESQPFLLPASALSIPIQNDFGAWSKNENKPISKYEKWMIYLGISSFIIGVVTVIIMIL